AGRYTRIFETASTLTEAKADQYQTALPTHSLLITYYFWIAMEEINLHLT
ncbi:hypothetical protein STEG23_034515, partial [Scotinomys teguina]